MENNSEIKFVIIMATYYRKNGKTKNYLERCLNSIITQKYNNWDLIIVGDKYEKEEELIEIIQNYKKKTNNKIIYINNQNVERENVKNQMKLWNCAGATSINIGLKYARENNYKYYCHLDDDDWWEDNHLKVTAAIYKKYKNCIFTCTKSKYLNSYLPRVDDRITIHENNVLPAPCGMVHSSYGFRIDVLDLYYLTDLNNGIDEPSDANMLKKIQNFILKNDNYCSIYVPVYTCNHVEEGEARK